MEWDEARLAELRVPDEQDPALEIDIGLLKPQRFAGTKPRRREQADECRIGVGSQAVRGSQMTRPRHEIPDLRIRKDVWLSSAPLAGKDSCGRDLRARIVRVQPGRESPDLTESASPRRALYVARRHGPAQRQVGGDERRALALHELDKMTEGHGGFAQLRAQRPPDRDILGQGRTHRRHRSPPVVGHGRATVRKASNETWV